jgi:hypothetical protein
MQTFREPVCFGYVTHPRFAAAAVFKERCSRIFGASGSLAKAALVAM